MEYIRRAKCPICQRVTLLQQDSEAYKGKRLVVEVLACCQWTVEEAGRIAEELGKRADVKGMVPARLREWRKKKSAAK